MEEHAAAGLFLFFDKNNFKLNCLQKYWGQFLCLGPLYQVVDNVNNFGSHCG